VGICNGSSILGVVTNSQNQISLHNVAKRIHNNDIIASNQTINEVKFIFVFFFFFYWLENHTQNEAEFVTKTVQIQKKTPSCLIPDMI